jgi:ADP-ribose pyrophosphatase
MNDTRILHTGQFLELKRDGHWEYVSRVNSSSAVFVLAITDDDELLLVEQYRVPLRCRTIELPAGIVGDEAHLRGESAAESALRELEEETGYRGRRVETLIDGPVAAGLTSELLHLVRIRDLQRVHDGGGVGNENIVVHRVPMREVDAWLGAQAARGLLIEPRIYAALYFARR